MWQESDCIYCEQEWGQNCPLWGPNIAHYHPGDTVPQSDKLRSLSQVQCIQVPSNCPHFVMFQTHLKTD